MKYSVTSLTFFAVHCFFSSRLFSVVWDLTIVCISAFLIVRDMAFKSVEECTQIQYIPAKIFLKGPANSNCYWRALLLVSSWVNHQISNKFGYAGDTAAREPSFVLAVNLLVRVCVRLSVCVCVYACVFVSFLVTLEASSLRQR